MRETLFSLRSRVVDDLLAVKCVVFVYCIFNRSWIMISFSYINIVLLLLFFSNIHCICKISHKICNRLGFMSRIISNTFCEFSLFFFPSKFKSSPRTVNASWYISIFPFAHIQLLLLHSFHPCGDNWNWFKGIKMNNNLNWTVFSLPHPPEVDCRQIDWKFRSTHYSVFRRKQKKYDS